METGLAKLIEAIKEIWKHLKPYAAVYSWEHGALVRRGKYRKSLGPGYYFKWPIIDLVVSTATAVQTMRGPTQSIGDRHFKWTCKYFIADLEKYTCDITDETQYLRDVLTAHVADFAREEDTPQARVGNWDRDKAWELMLKRLRTEAGEGGFKIIKLRIVDDANGFSFRMFGDVGEMVEKTE